MSRYSQIFCERSKGDYSLSQSTFLDQIRSLFRSNGLISPRIYLFMGRSMTYNFDAYRIGEQRWIRRVCAYAQSRQSLRCSHTQSLDEAKGSDLILNLASLDTSAWTFISASICDKYQNLVCWKAFNITYNHAPSRLAKR